MSCDVLIVGLPPAAGCPIDETWRVAAELVHSRLTRRFGSEVRFEYVDLFSPQMAPHADIEVLVADGAALPIVVIDGAARFTGGKLQLSAIEREVAERLAKAVTVSSTKERVS
jgi:disulfide oxidoreductase YuzD